MEQAPQFVDIHCHLLPGIDDGSKSWDESLAMAEMAYDDGIGTIVVTPHQLGSYSHNQGDFIRSRTAELQEFLDDNDVPLRVLPGADVRIEADMIRKLRSGEVVTLADRHRHVLLELPHELYFPLDEVLNNLRAGGMEGILSHPERNQGLLKKQRLVEHLVDAGCLMQVTAGSLMGTFGPQCQEMSEWMVQQGLVHFIATDAHGPRSRRPLMGRAFERVAELSDEEAAWDVCCHNPAAVADGEEVPSGRRARRPRGFADWFRWRRVG